MSATPSIHRRKLREQREWITWYLAWILLIVSWLATIVTANGGWSNILSFNISLTATVLAIVLQAVLTYTQWTWNDNLLVCYLSRTVDAVFTAIGFGQVIITSINPYMDNLWLSVSWLSIFLVAVIVAWYPEYRLVKD